MALARLFSAQCTLARALLLPHTHTPCVLSVACKQTVAEQLGLPNPPKRPLSPYLRFIQQYYEENKAKFPKLSSKEIFAKSVQDWRNTNADDKLKWTSQYEKEKAVYDIRYSDYVKQLSPNQLDSIKILKKKRSDEKIKRQQRREKKKECEELGKPKYPGNAFMLYLSTLDRGDAPAKEFMSGAAKQWNMLPEETQIVYREKAKESLKIYQNDLAEWEVKMLKAGRADLVRVNQLKEEFLINRPSQKGKN
ncbi:transcription factor A, mitochondrial [Procambarus clarkii]|uniref:transcription factor A, mitochondrial n=1 Tax=Procambarus clarkii TaxID=6728 RepID=UPI001E67538B|nr:transcription factor A, mitochondrial-like [Procambarus clarkii]